MRAKKVCLSRRMVVALLLGVAVVALSTRVLPITQPAAEVSAGRNPRWAVPLEKEGVPNLHRIHAGLYRGAQPTDEGMRALRTMGVKTIVNLRRLHSDRDEIGDLPLEYVHIKTNAWDVDEDEVVAFLRIVTDPEYQPVFFHCQHGADRTGTMAAIYRIVVEGWSKEEALKEMTQGGFNFHAVWKNLPEFINKLDVEKIRSRLEVSNNDE